MGKLTFGEVTDTYRRQLQASDVRPNTEAYRDAGIKLVFNSWDEIADLNVRRITSRTVEDSLRRFKANARPHVPVEDIPEEPAHLAMCVDPEGNEIMLAIPR